MTESYNTHYITLDALSRITDGWSDGPHPERDTSSATVLREDGSYQFRLYPGGQENPPLTDMDGVHLYKYVDGQVYETTPDERAAELAEIVANLPPPVPDVWDMMAAAYEEGVNEA